MLSKYNVKNLANVGDIMDELTEAIIFIADEEIRHECSLNRNVVEIADRCFGEGRTTTRYYHYLKQANDISEQFQIDHVFLATKLLKRVEKEYKAIGLDANYERIDCGWGNSTYGVVINLSNHIETKEDVKPKYTTITYNEVVELRHGGRVKKLVDKIIEQTDRAILLNVANGENEFNIPLKDVTDKDIAKNIDEAGKELAREKLEKHYNEVGLDCKVTDKDIKIKLKENGN